MREYRRKETIDNRQQKEVCRKRSLTWSARFLMFYVHTKPKKKTCGASCKLAPAKKILRFTQDDIYGSLICCLLSIVFFGLTSFAHAVSSNEKEQDQYQHYIKSFLYQQRGDYTRALDELFAVKTSTPSRLKEKDIFMLLLKKNHILAAKEKGEAFLNLYPDDYDVLLAMAYLSGSAEDLSKAIAYAEKAKEIKPDIVEADYYLGIFWSHENKNDKAIDAFKRVLDAYPKSTDVLKKLANLSQKKNLPNDAKYYYNEITKLHPLDAQTWWNLGLLSENSEPEKAEKYYLQALENENNIARRLIILNKLGMSSTVEKDKIKAVLFFEQVLSEIMYPKKLSETMKTQYTLALTMLTKIYVNNNEFEKAITYQKTLLKYDPKNISYTLQLAFLYERIEDYKNTIKVIRKTLKLFPKHNELHLLLGLVYEKQNKPRKAIKSFKNAITANANGIAHLHLAMMYDQIGKKTKAFDTCKKLLSFEPKNPDAANYVAYILAKKELDLEKAERLVKIALETYPDLPEYIDTLGLVYYKQKFFKKALSLFQKASHTKLDAEIFEHLGDTLLALEKKEEAYYAFDIAEWLGYETKRRTAKMKSIFPFLNDSISKNRTKNRLQLLAETLNNTIVSGNIKIKIQKKMSIKGTFYYLFPDKLLLRLKNSSLGSGDIMINKNTVFRSSIDGKTYPVDFPILQTLIQKKFLFFPRLNFKELLFQKKEKQTLFFSINDVLILVDKNASLEKIIFPDGLVVRYYNWKSYIQSVPWPQKIKIGIDNSTAIDIWFYNIRTLYVPSFNDSTFYENIKNMQ